MSLYGASTHQVTDFAVHTACNGTIVEDPEHGNVIQLQGDQRNSIYEFLSSKEGLELEKSTIQVHGF